jgi:hypothetical protein
MRESLPRFEKRAHRSTTLHATAVQGCREILALATLTPMTHRYQRGLFQ